MWTATPLLHSLERAGWILTLSFFARQHASTPHKYDIKGRSDRRPRARLRFDPTLTLHLLPEALTQARGISVDWARRAVVLVAACLHIAILNTGTALNNLARRTAGQSARGETG